MLKKISIFLSMMFFISFSVIAEDSAEGDGVEYLPLQPDLVVNLQNGRRSYLRAGIQLLIDSKEKAEKIKIHTPAMRHAVIMLASEYSSDQLGTQEQREEFRKKALKEVRGTLDEIGSSRGLSDLYFTAFLVQ